MASKPLFLALIASTLAVAALVGENAEAALKKVKRIDTHRLVRKQLKGGKGVKVVVPTGKDVRAIHLITDAGRVMTIDTSNVRFGQALTGVPAGDGTDLCGPDRQERREYVQVTRCCQEDDNQVCTSVQSCKQDVAICVDGNGSSYPSTGVPYQCLACTPVPTSPGTTQTAGG